ncbi:hypothetical protein ACHAQH_009862, partial [Verticillium albo-atrum]
MTVPRSYDGRPLSLFKYSHQPVLPLDGSHIRLLRLDKAKGDTAELRYASPLCCSLIETPIANPQPFNALSYTWGTGERTHWIEVAGSTLTITSSLDVALRHIRSDDQDVTIWIDQICIDQNDMPEKTSQVRIMGQIYSKASKAIVWLGPSADGSNEVMDCLQDIGQAAHDLDFESYFAMDKIHSLHSMLNNLDPIDEVGWQFKALVDRGASAFEPLYWAVSAWNKRPWFQRVWTIQEVGLCPDAVFQCGSKMVKVEVVLSAYHIFYASITRLVNKMPDAATLKTLTAAQDGNLSSILLSRRHRQKFDKEHVGGENLLSLLRRFFVERTALATEPRDRIYGLLGLAIDSERLGIVPDYIDDDPGPSFTVAARAIIQDGWLELLSYAQFPKETALEGLPSWVPDWRPMLERSFCLGRVSAKDHLFAAAGENNVDLVPTESTSVLGIRGYIVDTIEQVTATWNNFSDHAEVLSNLNDGRRLFELALAKEDPIYDNAQRRGEALWRVPIGDLYLLDDQDVCRPPSNVKFHYDRYVSLMEMSVGYSTAGPEELMAILAKSRHFQKQATSYQNATLNLSGKRPFLTENGFLGMCPDGAQAGDVVVVLTGSRIPHVLRPVQGGERFSFVGEAYCDGIMYGET